MMFMKVKLFFEIYRIYVNNTLIVYINQLHNAIRSGLLKLMLYNYFVK